MDESNIDDMDGDDTGATVLNIEEPREHDVLCGRGGAALRHPGNQTYRRLVHLNKGLYITCLKAEKLKISRSIVAAIREQNGRFLERDTKKGTWYDIGDKKAMEKTSQALREGQPKLRQKIVELGGGAAGAAALLESQFPHPDAMYDLNQQAQNQQHHHQQHQQQQHHDMQNQQMQQQQMQQQGMYNSAAEMPPPPSRQYQQEMFHPAMGFLTDTIHEEPPLQQLPHHPLSMSEFGGIESTLSLMSDFSNFGMETEVGMNRSQFSSSTAPSLTQGAMMPGPGDSGPQKRLSMDRRKYFARMKYSRPPSGRFSQHGSTKQLYASNKQLQASNQSLGDGMPDIHLVESNPSLLSNMSAHSSDHQRVATMPENIANIFESRRSLMSGLSRISDTSDVHSIFSDLSKKIGNVSTRSIAMSEISNFEEEVDPDTIPNANMNDF
jgi:hypothetical protein